VVACWPCCVGSWIRRDQLKHVLPRVQRDPALKSGLQEAITVDELARLAHDLCFAVCGSDILRVSGQ
jgi:hypothetical protein